VAGAHFWPALQVTPVHRGTQAPVVETHFVPAAHVTPLHLSMQAPSAGAHFWSALQVTPEQFGWQAPPTHFCMAGQVTMAQAQAGPTQVS